MTEHEIRLARALGGCSFVPGTSQKRFCRNMAELAKYSPERELSDRQRYYMEIMAWRFRQQLPRDLVPDEKPLPLPAVIKPPRAPKPRKVREPAKQEAFL